jgi:hypothetical protein
MNGHIAPHRGQRLWWIVGGASALVLVWCCVRSPVSVGDAAARGSAEGTDSKPGAPATTDSDVADKQRGVEATVAARNRETARESDAFTRAGWTMVAAPAPDARLLALDPALIDQGGGRERELRVQIASTVAAPELAPRLGRIARAAHEPATRVAAVEALGRIGTHEAQTELLALLPDLPVDDDARRQLVPLLRPNGLDDELATRLAAQLDGGTLTATEKKQLAFTLALVGLRDGMKLPDGAMSPAAKQLIDQMTALAQRGSGEKL